MQEPRLPDQRLRFALRQLAEVRQVSDVSHVHRAETLVISLLLPRAIAVAHEALSGCEPVDLERTAAARLTRAVMDWDPGAVTSVEAVASVVWRAVAGIVGRNPDRTSAPCARPEGPDDCGPVKASE